MECVSSTMLPSYLVANTHQSLRTARHVNIVKITKVGHPWFNTFSSLSDPRKTVTVLESPPPLKG